ncbi:cation-transporting P-type ATPase [Candidatus Woesearchaeota archaeon]|nr:MAG: cation-transporting P-type ATPase [Candidatus Woesearchaeota archaeon]
MLKKGGLTKKEAEEKLVQFGRNEIEDKTKATPFKIVLRQIKSNFILYLLAVAMLISFSVGKATTGYTILIVIAMVVVIGFIQEYRAERAIAALKGLLVPVSIVIRDGNEQEIPSINIVPGDVLILRNGEKIPADCLILEEQELRINESILTGESKEVGKKTGDEEKYTDENVIFMGTYIVNGRCIAKVIHTGMNTKFGKIAGMISAAEKELPLQEKVNKIAKYTALFAMVISILAGVLMLLRIPFINEEAIINTLIVVIAMSVAAFPEGFPVVLMTTLASGAHKMAKQNVIVNRMSIIETIGETTVICSDKTGTITKGEMTIKKVFAGNTFYTVTGTGYDGKGEILYNNKKAELEKNPSLQLLIRNAVLCNDAIITQGDNGTDLKIIGSPTESALLILGAKAGIFKEDLSYKRVQEIPFNSERKMMSVLCEADREKIVYSKGAPEYILRKCAYIQKNNEIAPLAEKDKAKILDANKSMTLHALRTVAFAYKKVSTFQKDHFEEALVFTGLAGMEDAAREEVKEAIAMCSTAGIKVKMITGDNKETALAIAKEIGLSGNLMEGPELDNITDDELAKVINTISIFTRVKPEHKLRIVHALKKNGEVVAMTGDGVNDAPALKEAHIGIAMGKNGTDVSRSVADLTLKDDNFKTIVSAISGGRTIFKNIRKFSTYQLSCTFAEMTILLLGIILAPLLGWQIPILLALQILFMNLVTSDLPAITLGVNPQSQDVMKDAPRKNSMIMNKNSMLLLFFTSSLLAVLVLASYFIAFNILGQSAGYARTVALFSLICLEIASAFNYRSFRKGVLTRSLLVNKPLFYASVISLIATLAIIFSPLNRVFETVPIMADGFLIAVAVSFILIIVFDLVKRANNEKKFFDLEHI